MTVVVERATIRALHPLRGRRHLDAHHEPPEVVVVGGAQRHLGRARPRVDPDVGRALRHVEQCERHDPADPHLQRLAGLHRPDADLLRLRAAGRDTERGAHRLDVTEREPVAGADPHQGASAGGVGREPREVQPAHQRRGDAVRLPLDQVRRRGHLVGHRAHRHGQWATVVVGGSAQVLEHGQARAAEGQVGEAVPPRSPGGVAEHDGQGCGRRQFEPVEQGGAQPGRLGVGVLGQHEQLRRGAGVGGVDARGGHHRPGHRLHDPGDPVGTTALGDDAHRAGGDGILAGSRPGQAEALGDDLARHDEAVAGPQTGAGCRERVHEQARQVRTRLDLPDPDHRHDGEAADRGGRRHPCLGHAGTAAAMRRACSAMRPVVSTSLISSGPSKTSTRARRRVVPASAGSTNQPSRKSS